MMALGLLSQEFEGWLRPFAAAGGNYVRLWLGHEFFNAKPKCQFRRLDLSGFAAMGDA